MMTFIFEREENIQGKEGNAAYQHLLLSQVPGLIPGTANILSDD